MKGGLRIIGGEWRGRRIPAPAGDSVRPTSDRVRETLFNWLTMQIEGARCLDLFAGSGALGLEALSRRARHVDFVEQDRSVARSLTEVMKKLSATERAAVHRQDARLFLGRALENTWDIVFVDPPFRQDMVGPVLEALIPHLNEGHRVYVEHEKNDAPTLAPEWQVLRENTAGQVTYRLLNHQNQ